MANRIEFVMGEASERGTEIGPQALLDRVEARLNNELPSPIEPHPFILRRSTLPGPAIAVVSALTVIVVIVAGVWLARGISSDFEGPTVDQPMQPLPTTVTPTTSAAPRLAPEAAAESPEAPWVAPGELRIGSSVITTESITVNEGLVTLRYEVTSLAPMNAVLKADDVRLSAPVLPERWSLETSDGSVSGTTSLSGNEVRFEADVGTTIDDILSVRLVSWKSIVPVTYDITVNAETRTPTRLPDGSEIEVSTTYTADDNVVITFDVTSPPDQPKAVACGGIRGLGSSCYDPVPATGWIHRETDAALAIMAPVGIDLEAIPLRYQRPMWALHTGSKALGLSPQGGIDNDKTDFPSGFVAIDDNEAIAPTSITRYGDQLLVSVISATRRGVDPTSFDPLIGGRWILETESGASIESRGTTYNDRVPGAFSVIFSIDKDVAIDAGCPPPPLERQTPDPSIAPKASSTMLPSRSTSTMGHASWSSGSTA
jgi:hypothetical protein